MTAGKVTSKVVNSMKKCKFGGFEVQNVLICNHHLTRFTKNALVFFELIMDFEEKNNFKQANEQIKSVLL
jgi:hypothetical protein